MCQFKLFKPFSVLFLIFLICSCGIIRLPKLLQKSYTTSSNYLVEFEVERPLGLVIIPVTINGKKYRFLWDTGAIMVINKELRVELGLKKVIAQNIRDSRGTTEKLEFVEIEELTLGDIPFYQVGTAVADLNKSTLLSCLKLDGIIGGNLMRKSVWQMDLENDKIFMASNIDTLNLSKEGIKVPFEIRNNGTPKVQVHINDTTVNGVTFDTGYTGYLSIGEKRINGKLDHDSIYSYPFVGFNSSGLYGASFDTVYKSKQLIGLDTNTQNQSVLVTKKNSSKSLLGLDYLENYRVTIDWGSQLIHLLPYNKTPKELVTRNITPFYNNNHLVVGTFLITDPNLTELAPNDTIKTWNNKNVLTISQSEFCETVISLPVAKDTIDLELINGKKHQTIKSEIK